MNGFDPFAAKLFLSGDWRPANSPGRQRILDPASLEPVGEIALVGEAEAEAALDQAAEAQRGWARLDAKTRAGYLHQIADSIAKADLEAIAVLMSREMGKPYPEALGELANVPAVYRYMAEMARDEAGQIPGTTQSGSFQYARLEPYGVSVHILPFNFPILLMSWTLAASLAAGNACVVKPAEATSLSTLAFMEHLRPLPPGLVGCVTGGPETGAALVASRRSRIVAVTGGVKTARAVGVACAERMKPCLIEAGGNDAFLVMKSAPPDVAAAAAVCAAFHLSGQVCTSAERFFVQAEAHDAFAEAFVARTQALRIGPGLERSEIGPLVSEAARAKVMRLVEDALSKGARILTGGRVPPGRNVGWFYEPTILADCTPDMALFREECFGPIAGLCKVADLEEAIALTNASDYGLGASLFTTELSEALRAAEAIETGMVWVNNPLIDNDALPFGGWKQSGLGRELGRQGLNAFRQSKMVVIDAEPKLHDWWYPYPDSAFRGG
ncbi:MAG: aldehyde dehydrogenase family protein [Rhodospirillales bacterium]